MMHVQYQKSQLNSHIDEDLQKAMNFDADTADLDRALAEIFGEDGPQGDGPQDDGPQDDDSA